MRFNYYYNFKNNIKFFVNVENVMYPTDALEITKTSWTKPFVFRIRNNENTFRTLKIPNIYNFKLAYDYYKDELDDLGYDFEKLEELDDTKRMQISYTLGEFKVNSYSENELIDYNRLVKYDYLIRMDIKSFYKNLYTHYIFRDISSDLFIDKPLSRLNFGRTGGIIMGNYLSLYFAELFSKNISDDLIQYFDDYAIDCEFSYFSDDFYFFCNKENIDNVINAFDKVLEKYDLEKNDEKVEIIDYLKYTSEDCIEKYWKTITTNIKAEIYNKTQQNNKLKEEGKKPQLYNNLFFTNQLIYRIGKINNFKKEKVFIVNFFKSEFFNTIDFSKTYFDDFNYHQICYILKKYPESILYINNIINGFEAFKSNDFKNLIYGFFKNSLKTDYQDEQLYYFVLMKKIDCIDKLKKDVIRRMVLESENFPLISYFAMYDLFENSDYQKLLQIDNEEYWFVHYNLIILKPQLYGDIDDAIDKYLVPKKAANGSESKYHEFYKINIDNNISILNSVEQVETEVAYYLLLKWNDNKDDVEDEEEKEEWLSELEPDMQSFMD